MGFVCTSLCSVWLVAKINIGHGFLKESRVYIPPKVTIFVMGVSRSNGIES